MIHLKIFLYIGILIMLAGTAVLQADAEEAKEPIGLDQHLGELINLDYRFRNEAGDTIVLRDFVDRPTILNFVYFNCPGICTPLLNGFQETLERIETEPGKDFKILTISINHDETPELARAKKYNYLTALQGKVAPEDWLWLTGDSLTIRKLTREVGFNFSRSAPKFNLTPRALLVLEQDGAPASVLEKLHPLKDQNYNSRQTFLNFVAANLSADEFREYGDRIADQARWIDFAHPAALTVISKDGKICRYLYGITFNQFDLQMAVIEADQGRTGPTIAKVIKFCFSYDPEGRTYVFNVLQVSATIMLLLAVIFVLVLTLKSKHRKKEGDVIHG